MFETVYLFVVLTISPAGSDYSVLDYGLSAQDCTEALATAPVSYQYHDVTVVYNCWPAKS